MEEQVRDVKFNALRNALYHAARRSGLETLNRFVNLIVIVSGAAAVSDLFGPMVDVRWFAFAATVAGALQLVCDFGGRAKEHEFLQKRFYDVITDIERSRTATEDDLCRWRADLVTIYADEPPTMRALDAIAYNNAGDALNMPMRIKIGFWRSLMRHILPFNDWSGPWVSASQPPDAAA